MKKKYILEMWEDFSLKVIRKTAPEIQRIEMKKAFFAGAVSLWDIIFRDLSPGAEAEEIDLQKMSAIQQEFEDYVKELSVK